MSHLLLIRDLEQAAHLVAALGDRGQVFIAVPGERFADLGQGRFSLRAGEAEDHARLLAALPAPPECVLYAWSWSQPQAVSNLPESIAAEQALGVEGAFLLTQALLAIRPAQLVRLLYVFASGSAPDLPVHEAFGAFARTVTHESRKLVWRQVCFSGAALTPLRQHMQVLRSEFEHAGDDVEVRYVGGARQRRVFREVAAPSVGPSALPIRDAGVYLISGGIGGLGYIVARHIASLHRVKLVLFGRRAFDSKIAERLEELEFLGAASVYYSVDVSDLAAVQQMVDEVHRTLGPVGGLFCGAGVNKDALIINKTIRDFRDVVRPKVMGAVNLDLALRDDPLDFVVYFSSIAALLGNAGQADYSFANSFLDHFAKYREALRESGQRQGRALSINWPLWKEGGMQVDEQVQKFAERTLGTPPLTTQTGLSLLSDAMRMASPQLFVARGDRSKLSRWFDFSQSKGNSPRVEAPSSTPQPVSAPAGHAADVSDAVMLPALQADLLAGVVDILQVDPKDAQVDTDLNRFGFDSLTFTTFGNRIAEALRIDLSPVVFFEYQTVRELSEYMLQEHRVEILAWYRGRHAPAPSPVPARVTTSAPAAVAAPAPAPSTTASNRPPVHSSEAELDEAIAIIGIDATLPQSEDLEAFWTHLSEGANLVSEVPAERWDWQAVWGDPFKEKNRTRIKWGGFVPHADKFDAAFFGISPREAELMDPQHRLFLQSVWRCIEDAGYRASSLAADYRVGVFCGSASIDYHDIMLRNGVDIDVFAVTGSMFSVLVNRISYLLNFRGPSEPVETACSSSLVAVHRAMQAIRAGECEIAVAGGVHLMFGPNVHIGLDKGGFLSQRGRCATFDKDADGYARGEGCVAFLLKSLARAEADGDVIHAVIRGSMVNHGGRVNTLTTPNPNAQTEVVVEAWKRAGVDPRTIGYIEAHGTGTALGDPIETKALGRAFEELYTHHGLVGVPREKHCGLGSVKSNIGHLEFVAGASGIAKVVLSMRHQTLPASIHFNSLNPYIQLDKTPLSIVDRRRPWERAREADGRPAPLRAGVSSFGFGGVNCHVALEEYRKPVERQAAGEPGAVQVVLLSAKDAEALDRCASRLLRRLQQEASPALGDLAYTLATGREAMSERLLIVARDLDELRLALARPASAGTRVYRGNKASGRARLAFLTSHEAARDFAQSLVVADDLPQMARCWVDGLDLNWEATRYARGRRVSLPTYPFARTRHWVPEAQPIAGAVAQPVSRPAAVSGFQQEVLALLNDGLLTETQAHELLSA